MITPKYFEHEDQCIKFLEWKALEKFTGLPSYKQFPEYSQRWGFWADHFNFKKKQWHHSLYVETMNGTISTLEDFYKKLEARLKGRKPKALGAQERKKQSQREYQKEKLGDGFVDNSTLISAIKLKAKELSNTRTPDEDFVSEASALALELSETPLSDDQIKVLSSLMSSEISKYQALDIAEAKLIDSDNKNAWFLWGKIKRNYPKDSKFTLSAREVAAHVQCSKDLATKLTKELLKAGLIRKLSPAKQSKTERIAALYIRCI